MDGNAAPQQVAPRHVIQRWLLSLVNESHRKRKESPYKRLGNITLRDIHPYVSCSYELLRRWAYGDKSMWATDQVALTKVMFAVMSGELVKSCQEDGKYRLVWTTPTGEPPVRGGKSGPTDKPPEGVVLRCQITLGPSGPRIGAAQ